MDSKFKYYALKLCALCIIIFGLQLIPGFTDLFLLNKSAYVEIWRFVTAIFLHGGLAHLLFNMFALALFGSFLEGFIGGKKFLIGFFTTGVLANVVSAVFYPASLGASGAIFGVIGALVIVRPLLVVWAFGLPMPMFIAGIIWAILDLVGAIGYFAGNPIDNTGNIAHLSGMFIGIVLGFLYRDWTKHKEKKEKLTINEGFVRKWEDYYMKDI